MKQSKYLFFLCLWLSANALVANSFIAKGKVFWDVNQNGIPDAGEKGIKNVAVSNGVDVVMTDENGGWELPSKKEITIFAVKPSGYKVPLNQNQTPLHFFKYENQKEINFPLTVQNENESFSAVFFGDTQARGLKEVDYIFFDAVDELIGTEAVFGVSLGDIVADDPELMDDISDGIAQIGIPWYNVFGNHDFDRGAASNNERDDTFERFFGPSTYAFEYGQVVFIALNNIFFNPDGKYRPHFTDEQLAFVENYLKFVPGDKLVVLMMHAPIVACDNAGRIYKLIQDREHTFSISGHVHEQINVFVDKKMGWGGKETHHHLINATVCGSWWCGLNDELGIPHATMNDGAPNGYSIISFEGNKYSIRFKAARRPENYQMNIYIPNEIETNALDTTNVLVNIFAGSDRSKVEMSFDKSNFWFPLDNVKTVDPECLRMFGLNVYLTETVKGKPLDEVFGYTMDYPGISQHIWQAKIPENLTEGTHTVSVRTTDMYNKTWIAHRVFRIKKTQ